MTDLLPGVEMLRGRAEHESRLDEMDRQAEERWRAEVRRDAAGEGLNPRTLRLYGYQGIDPKKTKRAREAQRILERIAREDKEERRMEMTGPACAFCHKPTRSNNRRGYHHQCWLDNGCKEPERPADSSPRAAATVATMMSEIGQAETAAARQKAKARQLEVDAVDENFDALATALGLDPEEMVLEYKSRFIDQVRRACLDRGIPGMTRDEVRQLPEAVPERKEGTA